MLDRETEFVAVLDNVLFIEELSVDDIDALFDMDGLAVKTDESVLDDCGDAESELLVLADEVTTKDLDCLEETEVDAVNERDGKLDTVVDRLNNGDTDAGGVGEIDEKTVAVPVKVNEGCEENVVEMVLYFDSDDIGDNVANNEALEEIVD